MSAPAVVSAAQAAGRRPLRQEVSVKLTATSFSSRKLQASVDINAPLPVVWEALTDYDNLGSFIPSLVENRCIERRKQGCLLYQVRSAVKPGPRQQPHLHDGLREACVAHSQHHARWL